MAHDRWLYRLAFSACVLFIMNMTTRAEVTKRQLTHAKHGHILTNIGCWSNDGRWIVYDVRPDVAGSVFKGNRIERVHVETGKIEVLYQSSNGAYCGVVTSSPVDDRVVFIHGPENPTPDWQYAGNHRRGVIVSSSNPGKAVPLDGRDIVPPFTAGALRGGTHVHVFSGDAKWVSFTYQDHVLAEIDPALDLRNVGVSVAGYAVPVPKTHVRNHDGSHFSVLVTRTTPTPTPGSDEIDRAYSDAWVGKSGYVRTDGGRQRALAFLGDLIGKSGKKFTELFVADLPENLTHAGSYGSLAGTPDSAPQPPAGVIQRRLTFTENRKFPGVQGIRHWPRSTPDGSKIGFLMKDGQGIAQLWTIDPDGGKPNQLTQSVNAISSAFSWSPDGNRIACVIDGSVSVVDASDGSIQRLTERRDPPPRSEACVFSPDGGQIAYVCVVDGFTQIFVCAVND